MPPTHLPLIVRLGGIRSLLAFSAVVTAALAAVLSPVAAAAWAPFLLPPSIVLLLLGAGGIGYYLSVSTTGITTGYGAMRMTADQLRRFRGAIDADISGIRFEELTQELAAQGLPVSPGADQPLKNAPRGWSTNHPRINFLRWKGAAVVQDWPTDTWMHTPQVHERIRDTWAAVEPLRAWLDEHVAQRSHEPLH